MRLTNQMFGELIEFSFIWVYQLIAYRAYLKSEHNLGRVSTSLFTHIWKLNDQSPPSRPQDVAPASAFRDVYIDDEMIRATSIALQNAWRTRHPRKAFPSELPMSNMAARKQYGIDRADYRDRYLEVVTELTDQERAWSYSIQKKQRRKIVAPPVRCIIYVSPARSGGRVWHPGIDEGAGHFTIPKHATSRHGIWNVLVERFLDDVTEQPSFDFSHEEIEVAILEAKRRWLLTKPKHKRNVQIPSKLKDVRTQVGRFNTFIRQKSGITGDVLRSTQAGWYTCGTVLKPDDPLKEKLLDGDEFDEERYSM